ncbi:hypothetical protein AMJ50_01220 [Parcubacteria bacterium DG_74_3]|nr:MAG: hypothetical protein AMJ50_01220 [Parcubacteria bacterium DG_74_3]
MITFDTGAKILLSFTAVFFLVFFYLCSLWSRPMHPEKRHIIGLMLSAIYGLAFLLIGFLALGIFFLIRENWEYWFNLIQSIFFK